jgi:outer membrane receptor protein involved in Fe transport
MHKTSSFRLVAETTVLSAILLLYSTLALAEDSTKTGAEDGKIKLTKPITVTATMSEREPFETPRAINLVSRKEYERISPTTALDALRDEIGIWTEIKTATTGDPVMRGLSGSNVLALIDGNTVTTLWGEGGLATDDLYGKIDSEWVDRIEVLRGPASTLYGSNCLGGIIHFFTKSSPLNFTDKGIKFGTRGKFGYGSAAGEERYRLELFGASPKLKFLIGGSKRDIGDYQGARGQGLLVPTSGKDLNWDLKVEFKPSEKHYFTITFQDTDRDNIHRYYRPKQDNFNDRHATSISYLNTKPVRWMDSIELRFYYQDKTDRRRDFASTKSGVAITDTIQSHLLANTTRGNHSLTYGFQYERDAGEDPDDEQFTWTDWEMQWTTKDAPDSVWQDYGVFFQDEWKLHKKWDLILSSRVDGFDFRSFPDDAYQPPSGQTRDLDRIHSRTSALTGGLGILYKLSESWNLFSNFSRGFRQFSPKFGITQTAWGIQVPNPLSDPTTSLSWEFGAKTKSPYVDANMAVFYTYFSGFPVPLPTRFQGKDWYDYNRNGKRDAGEDTYQNHSSANAYIYGIETDATVTLEALSQRIGPQWALLGGFSYNYAQDITHKEPFRHGTPTRGIIALKWGSKHPGGVWWEVESEIIGRWDRIPKDRLDNDPGYRVNPQNMSSPLVRPYGLPGYSVFNLKGGASFGEHVDVSLALDNVTNKNFRRAHSRMDDPGTNFRATIAFTY